MNIFIIDWNFEMVETPCEIVICDRITELFYCSRFFFIILNLIYILLDKYYCIITCTPDKKKSSGNNRGRQKILALFTYFRHTQIITLL